ncbi:MAG: tryptophan-rich sensory protein [Acidobacteria bacterium]|jgi:tryptophan-rich sensory protein|nr:tryptophan-rich sensory protein [Acidobacteriota bacterium]
MKGKIGKLIFSLAICQLAGIIGNLFNTTSSRIWYQTLNKPSFNPPDWVFAPVWVTLYILMGIALFLVWISNSQGNNKQIAMILFYIQLVFNTAWTFFFFFMQNPYLALVDIILLLIFILLTLWRFWVINRTAGYLLIPYLLWVGFAGILNYSIWILN